MQQRPGLIPGVGGSFPHIQRLAPGPPSPPWPRLCERNAKGAWVPQPCANPWWDQRFRRNAPFQQGWVTLEERSKRNSRALKEEPEVRRQAATSTRAPSATWGQALPSSGLYALICEMERLNSETCTQRWGRRLHTTVSSLCASNTSWIMVVLRALVY